MHMKNNLKTLLTICLSSCTLVCPLGNLMSASFSASTYNERHVAQQWNSTSTVAADEALVIDNLSNLSSKEQREALNDFSGEQYANLIQPNQTASQTFIRRMYQPILNDSLGLQCGENCDEYRAWGAVGGGQSRLHNSHGAKGYRMDNFNITFGAQKPLNLNFLNSWLTVGIAGSYEKDHIHFKQNGRGKGNNWQGAIYYMWNNPHFYSFSGTILGADCVRVKRSIDVGNLTRKAKGKARVSEWASFTELGLNLGYENFYVQPFARLEHASYRRHALSEHGAQSLNLHVRGKNISASVGYLGTHLSTNLPWWELHLNADAAWKYRFNLLQERFQAHFKNLGSQFRIKGVHQKTSGFEGSVNIAKTFYNCWQGYVEFSGEVWDRFSAWNLAGGVTVTW